MCLIEINRLNRFLARILRERENSPHGAVFTPLQHRSKKIDFNHSEIGNLIITDGDFEALSEQTEAVLKAMQSGPDFLRLPRIPGPRRRLR